MSKYAMTRGWMDHDFFSSCTAPFSDREAWVWMIGEARWEDGTIKGVSVKRGQLYASIRFMAEKFQWSKDRVTRFLKRAENASLIRTQTRTGQYLITLCNYDEHQFNPSDNKDSHKDANKDTDKDSNKDKQEEYNNIINKTTHSAREAFRMVYDTGSELFPTLATRHTAAITKWLEAGADPDQDILPTLRRAVGKDIRSWGYFSGAVMDAMATRTKPLPEGVPSSRQQQSTQKPDYMQGTIDATRRALRNIEGDQA